MESLLDPGLAETRVRFGIAEAEVAQRALSRSSALVFASIAGVLREAGEHPEVYIDAQMIRGDAAELAVRAAVADLAVQLSLAESTVRSQGHIASTLQQRLPVLWAWFVEGDVSVPNAREAYSVVLDLPAEAWARFDAEILDPARRLAPARFSARARSLAEKLDPAQREQRHERAASSRRVVIERDRDGMSWYSAWLPSATVAAASARVDAIALDLFRAADESRTLAQIRADVFADLLLGDESARPRVSLALTIPLSALTGQSRDPAVLEGAGPIDLDTARRLAAGSPSVTRLFTDPMTGSVLQMDPRQYRLTAALRRWLVLSQPTCDFPGCGRRSADCDIDHTVAWAAGGVTAAHNLAPRCRAHHRLKHESRWRVSKPPGAARAVWTSPTGFERESDPPPF